MFYELIERNKFTNVLPIYFHTETAMCLAWGEKPTSSCSTLPSGKGKFKALDRNMRNSDTSKCQALCQQEQQNGCCYLKTGLGCYWRAGGSAKIDGGSAMATTCYAGENSINERVFK